MYLYSINLYKENPVNPVSITINPIKDALPVLGIILGAVSGSGGTTVLFITGVLFSTGFFTSGSVSFNCGEISEVLSCFVPSKSL